MTDIKAALDAITKAYEFLLESLDQQELEVPSRFLLNRTEDETGMSGTGIVASGVQFPNGKVVLCWHTETSSVALYDSIEDLVAIHGHNGKTQVKWID